MRYKFSTKDRYSRRILFVEVNEDGTVGGSHQCLYDIVTHIDCTAWEPVLLFYQANRFAVSLREAGFQTHVWDQVRTIERIEKLQPAILARAKLVSKTFGAVFRRWRFLLKERIALVHMNNSPSSGFIDWLPAARLAGVPIISHSRGSFGIPKSALARWLTKRFDAVIAISRYIAERCDLEGIPHNKIRQIYDGIDLKLWVPRPPEESQRFRMECGVSDDTLLVVLVGQLHFWKGQDVALAAMRIIDPKIRRLIRLWFIGATSISDAWYAEGLQRFVTEHDLGDVVQFFGFRTNIPELMGAADVVLHASTIPEPFGLVILEGLALGKTVVASKLGGPSEILGPDDGLLFDPNRPAELARILTQLTTSPEMRRQLGARGRIRASDFDIQYNVNSLMQIWVDLLNQ